MFKSAVTIYILSFLFAHLVWALPNSSKCQDLAQEVTAMKKAHQQLLNSLLVAQNLAAQELEEISSEAELNQGYLDKKKILEIKSNSLALKSRNQKTQRLVDKLDLISTPLLTKLASCLR